MFEKNFHAMVHYCPYTLMYATLIILSTDSFILTMKVRIAQRYREELCMRQSALMSSAMSNIQKDILSQPLQLLSGVDILGNASSALSNMSKGIAALSMDKKFIQGRMRQVHFFLRMHVLNCIKVVCYDNMYFVVRNVSPG